MPPPVCVCVVCLVRTPTESSLSSNTELHEVCDRSDCCIPIVGYMIRTHQSFTVQHTVAMNEWSGDASLPGPLQCPSLFSLHSLQLSKNLCSWKFVPMVPCPATLEMN